MDDKIKYKINHLVCKDLQMLFILKYCFQCSQLDKNVTPKRRKTVNKSALGMAR